MDNICIFCDVETDGPSPVKNNLVAVSLIAFCRLSKKILGFCRYAVKSQEKEQNASTMEGFWKNHPDLYKMYIDNGMEIYDVAEKCNSFIGNILEHTNQTEYEFGSDCLGFEMKWMDYLFNYADMTAKNNLTYFGTDIYSTADGYFGCGRLDVWKHIESVYQTPEIVNNHDCLSDVLKQALLYSDICRLNAELEPLKTAENIDIVKTYFLHNGAQMNIERYFI